MAVINNSNIQVLKYAGAIFNEDIQTPEVTLDNAQAAHFVITSGEGTPVTAKVRIMAKYTGNDAEPVLIREEGITIGDHAVNKIVVAAREICHDEKDSVYLTIANPNAPDIVGVIIALLTNERFSTEG